MILFIYIHTHGFTGDPQVLSAVAVMNGSLREYSPAETVCDTIKFGNFAGTNIHTPK